MKQFFHSPHPFLVPVGIAAALLALLIAGFTGQPSTGWGGQYAAVTATYDARTQAISKHFNDGNAVIWRMRPADSPAAQQARIAVGEQWKRDTQANARQWQASLRRIQYEQLQFEALLAAAFLLMVLSLALFAAKFYHAFHFRRQRIGV